MTPAKLTERLRADDMLYNRGPDYEPIRIGASALRLEAADRIEELEKALEPFVAMIRRLDGDAIAMLRAQQPEAVITDEELAELHLPSKQVMITDGVMAFGRSDPRPDKTVVTAGHLRTARRAIEGWDNAER